MPAADPERWALVHVITRLELGGAQRVCLRQLCGARLGAGARYLAYGPGGLLDDEAAALPGVSLLPVPALGRALRPGADGRALVQLVRALRRVRRLHPKRALLVHTHSSKAGMLGRLAAHLSGAQLVVHSIHGFGHQPHQGRIAFAALAAAERAAARLTHGFVAVAEANARRARAEGWLRYGARCRVVRAGANVAAYGAPIDAGYLARELQLAPDTPLVVGISCLKAQKDPLSWVRVAARVCTRVPRAVFALAGDGVLRDDVTRAVQRAGLAGRVHVLGWRHDVAALLQRAQLLLHTSRWEGLPQAFVQAMAAGLPIVATNVDGAAEAVEHGVSGLLCAPGDVDALSRACVALLAAPDVALAMGQRGKQRAWLFDEAPMLHALDAYYDALAHDQANGATRPRAVDAG